MKLSLEDKIQCEWPKCKGVAKFEIFSVDERRSVKVCAICRAKVLFYLAQYNELCPGVPNQPDTRYVSGVNVTGTNIPKTDKALQDKAENGYKQLDGTPPDEVI